MRASREQVAANREAIVVSAGQQFRKRGFDDVTIADVMKAAGLTHGGFYGYFDSKEALAATVCERGVTDSVAAVAAVATQDREDRGADAEPLLQQFVRDYVSARHRDAPEDGCSVAALAHHAGRSSAEIQSIIASGIKGMAESLSHLRELDAPDRGPRSEPDFATLSTMIGALALSRAVADADPRLSDTILEAARVHIETSA
ncbi:TetR/AcrR family transcriptional regulator [Streptomyces krungchingensis]|uniref:TetR/AcrR family transcriptional regulator n=1 Tax=Streptomyces krungchingensis TaxID=1565034 RepID=UPI003CE845FE